MNSANVGFRLKTNKKSESKKITHKNINYKINAKKVE